MSRPTLAPRPPPGGSAETTQLPAMCPDRSALEAAGVVFGERADRDGLFVHATLPPGWRKAVTSHSMWFDLLDEKGRKRAAIFDKTEFYDRRARLRACPRYSVEFDFDRQDQTGEAVAHVMDGKSTIYTTDPAPPIGRKWEQP